MATKLVTSLLTNQIDNRLPLIRTQIRDEGKKKLHKLREKLPSVTDLKEQFSSSACSLQSQKKMEKRYNNTKKIIEKIINKAEKGKLKLDKLEEKLRKILEIIIPKIENILNFLKPIITALRILVRVIPLILKSIPTSVPGVTGGMIIEVNEKRKKAVAKIAEWANLIITINDFAIPSYRKKISKILSPINKALSLVNNFIESIKARLAVLDLLYLQYIQTCNIGDLSASNSGNINENLLNPDLSNIIEELQSLYGNLLNNVTDVKVIERIENTKFGFKTS